MTPIPLLVQQVATGVVTGTVPGRIILGGVYATVIAYDFSSTTLGPYVVDPIVYWWYAPNTGPIQTPPSATLHPTHGGKLSEVPDHVNPDWLADKTCKLLKQALKEVEDSIEQREYELDPTTPDYDSHVDWLQREEDYRDKLKEALDACMA